MGELDRHKEIGVVTVIAKNEGRPRNTDEERGERSNRDHEVI
jgi:hypothetical protein